MAKQGREGFFGDPEFDHNIVPDSGKLTAFDSYGKEGLPKFGHGCGIGKENDIRDSDDRSTESSRDSRAN